jgi:anti-sigma factor RsiW
MNEQPNNSKPDASADEQLTAYLDGELDDDVSREIEQRLGDDEQYREQLKRLDEAWALLDHLPQSDVDDVFTQTTVEMVALAAEKDARTAERGRRRRAWLAWSGTIAVVVLAAVFGYLAARYRLDRPNRQLVKDLPVIENVDVYQYAESTQWLEMLDESGLFGDDEELDDAI